MDSKANRPKPPDLGAGTIPADRGNRGTAMAWTPTRMSISVTGAAAVVSGVLATSTIWLLLTSPATLAAALNEGTVTPVIRELAAAVVHALSGLLAYL